MSRDQLSVLQVSPSEIGGGAEKVAYDLMRAYRDRELDSWLAVGRKQTADPNVVEIPNEAARPAWTRVLVKAANALHAEKPAGFRWALDRALRTAANPAHMAHIQRGLEDFDFPATTLIPDLTPRRPDVLHLHNLHGGYFDIRALPRLATAAPVAVTMHDVWLLTGHCAYPMSCERWQTGCGDCPDLALPQPIRRDASAENARIKREALAAARVHVASPSRWLADLVRKSGVAETLADLRVIPNGVDTDVFSPGDRASSRERLGLPHDALVIVYTAVMAKASPFKGFSTLEAALPRIARGLNDMNVLLVAVGQNAPDTEIEGVPVRYMPFVDDPAEVAEYYRAADLYLHPAHAENFPLAVLEAMACGTPVVASDTGGIPEIVEDGVTGRLFDCGDADALASVTIGLARDAEERSRLAANGAVRVRERFRFETQVESYLEWYREILGSTG